MGLVPSLVRRLDLATAEAQAQDTGGTLSEAGEARQGEYASFLRCHFGWQKVNEIELNWPFLDTHMLLLVTFHDSHHAAGGERWVCAVHNQRKETERGVAQRPTVQCFSAACGSMLVCLGFAQK